MDSASRNNNDSLNNIRQFKCQHCTSSFDRSDHLQRHTKIHTASMIYQCPCACVFSRSDTLARHLRTCDQGHKKQYAKTLPSKKQTRAKSACNFCAAAKTKCDSREPCGRCQRKMLRCLYTRAGYSDPYHSFRIQAFDAAQIPNSATLSHIRGPESEAFAHKPATSVVRPTHECPLDPSIHAIREGTGSESRPMIRQDENIAMNQLMTSQTYQNPTTSIEPQTLPWMSSEFDFESIFDFTFEEDCGFDVPGIESQSDLQASPFANVPSIRDDCTLAISMNTHDDSPAPNTRSASPTSSNMLTKSNLLRAGGFKLDQLDPVQAKCQEIVELIRKSPFELKDDAALAYFTRNNLITCVALYGTHFQPNLPMLHMPSFMLTMTCPALLLAIVLIGACYSGGFISRVVIDEVAMALLVYIGNQPHEREMQVPPLSTIQAGSMLGYLLNSSRNTVNFQASQVNLARNISMAERALLFEPVSATDFSTLISTTFDWEQWKQEEARRRTACRIFCQDMARCILKKKPPSMSPNSFEVLMPCFDVCWEADSKEECLRQLQLSPLQMRVSSALKYLSYDGAETESPVLEVSSFGMFILILSLHSFLFHMVLNTLDNNMDVAPDPTVLSAGSNHPWSRFNVDFSGKSVTRVANELVLSHGSPTMRRVNVLFDRWLRSWEARHKRDRDRENRAFSSDPLRFFWLAKLYIILHFYRHSLHKDPEFAVQSKENPSEPYGQQPHLRIVGWLSNFQERLAGAETPTWTDYYLRPFTDPPTS